MESEGQLRQQRIARFWKRYIRELRLYQVPDTALPWYRRHVQGFIDFDPHTRLADRRPETLQQWFADSNQSTGFRDWQQRQRVDALRLLYCLLVKTEWAATFDWQAWADVRHLPMAGETTKSNKAHLHHPAQRSNGSPLRPAASR